MSCPFYAHGLLQLTPEGHGLLVPNESNRCALIIPAHSPCWMEVGEERAPDWAACPRNPEFVTDTFRSEAELGRFNRHAEHMDVLRTARTISRVREDAGLKADA